VVVIRTVVQLGLYTTVKTRVRRIFYVSVSVTRST